MGEVRRNINLRLPSKSKAPSYHSSQISPYTDRLVEELSSGRDSRAEARKGRATLKPSTPAVEEGEEGTAGERRKWRDEEQIRALTMLVQEKSLKIENLELTIRTLKHQVEHLTDEKY